MDYDRVPVCRLCLEIVYDGKFQEAENIIIILQNMLPQLNFTVSSQPVICNKCMEIIQKSYSFKSVCLETEKYLQNYRPSGSSTIYLEEAVYNKMLENEIKAEKTNKGKICRFCLQILEGDLSTQLGVVEYMLGKCLAELDLTISANPVICGPCLENLQNQFYFIMSCLDIEARINNYCSTRDTNSNDPVNLHDMLVYTLQTPGDKINHNTSFNGLRDVNVKLEDSDSKNAKSLKEYERDFIEDGVNSDSTLDANLEVAAICGKDSQRSGNKCAYLNCGKSRRDYPYLRQYRFPAKDAERCKQWIINSGNTDLLRLSPNKYRIKVVCSDHFEDKDFLSSCKLRLNNNAVPKKWNDSTESSPILTEEEPPPSKENVNPTSSLTIEMRECLECMLKGPKVTSRRKRPIKKKPNRTIKRLRLTIQRQRNLLKNKRLIIAQLRKQLYRNLKMRKQSRIKLKPVYTMVTMAQ